jgi:LysM repeat protein
MLKTALAALCITSTLATSPAQASDPPQKMTRSEYIEKWKDVAVKNMREHGIPASITLAQGILESGDGNSRLAREGNNHFGIKCHDWTGAKMYHDDDAKGECFRKYKSAQESFEDHSLFLKKPRYLSLYEHKSDDYKAWAHGLKKAGYATNPKYPELLIRIIEENNLTAFDKEAISGKSAKKPAVKKPKGNTDEIVLEFGGGIPQMVSENNIRYIVASKNETVEDLARSLNMGPWQLRKYNDLGKDESIEAGSRVYLQPKRSKSAGVASHKLQAGENLRDVSQKYGVKMSKILKYSGFEKDYEPKAGDILKLK